MATATERLEPTASSSQRAGDGLESETGPLQSYFRGIARTDVMTAAQELVLAGRIESLRRELWHLLLGYPPFVAGICELAREVLGGERSPVAALDAMTVAARKLRDRDLVTHRKQYADERQRLAAALSETDPDGAVLDRVFADLLDIEGGVPGTLNMRVKLPPQGSLPFLAYVSGCKAKQHLLVIARSEFIAANLRLVVMIARRYSRGPMALQDLVQEGNLGLMKAVNRFDARKGCRFSTYGSWWIRHAITRAMADKGRTVRLPVHMLETRNKVMHAHRRSELLNGRPADDAELMTATGASRERLARMQLAIMDNPLSLDQKLGPDAALGLLDMLADDDLPSAPEMIDHALHLDQLHELFGVLTPLEVDILRRRVGLADHEEMTLKEIGAHYNLSRERIRQLQEQALEKLRGAFRERGLL